jgi:hypothetical protein
MENEMQCRVYDSKTIETMGWAFDKAFEDLSEGSKHRPSVQRNLALSIIRFFMGARAILYNFVEWLQL